MTNPPDDYPDDDCPNCGGEGVVYDCIDGFCEDAEEGCDLCAHRCDWCNPPKQKSGDGEALRQILADALEANKPLKTPHPSDD
jgi:hypothetical protein